MRKDSDLILYEKYPPSQPCDCKICKAFCRRPGWWTVEEARKVMKAGLSKRMMLELSPDLSYGVLSPAFYGCGGFYALQEYTANGCNFLKNGLCELHDTGLQPLECCFCHHKSNGMGAVCHSDLEKDWNTPIGQSLVRRWMFMNNLLKDN